uniref:Terminase n=1 Tax=viral metagenome TaxID=1070528 RepID=A0A6H1ZZT3_9ZZZZ
MKNYDLKKQGIPKPEINEQLEKPKQKQLGKTKNDLRRRARKIANAIIEGKSETEALKCAGYSASYALTRKKEILNNPHITKTFASILDAAGLTDDYLAGRIKQLAEAKETKFFQEKGVVTETREVDALGIQADMIQFGAKLRGAYPAETHNVNVRGSIDLFEKIKEARERAKKRPKD